MTITDFIEKYEPCSEAATWLLTQPDLQSAWNTCTRIDWMLWALEKVEISEQQTAKLSAEFVYCTPLSDGRVVADLLTDQRSIDFLQLKRSWGDAEPGAPRPAQWEAAWEAARAAREAAWAAGAAREAAWAAWAAGAAADAAWEAAWAAAWAAREAAGAAGAEAAATRKTVRKQQCDIIRSVFPVCPF